MKDGKKTQVIKSERQQKYITRSKRRQKIWMKNSEGWREKKYNTRSEGQKKSRDD